MERLDLLAAREQDVEPVFSLYEKRVAWMDEARGCRTVGTCRDGLYCGCLREKRL